MDAILEEIRRQAHWCGEFGSPFTRELLLRAADDLAAGGPVAAIVAGWESNPFADALSLRLAGALHAAVLTGRDAALAAEYPAARAAMETGWSMDRVWPLARDFMEREAAWTRDFLQSPPQTNETGRAAGLGAAFLWLAQRSPEPFHMLELGASAGLNMHWDSFRFTHTPWGREAGEGPLAATVIEGAAPGWRPLRIASRAACDQNPLDPSDPYDRLRLRAYVWADQAARMERLNAAIALASASPLRVEKADAAKWVAAKLAPVFPRGTTVIYHSVFLQYPPQETRDAIRLGIEAAGARASVERGLAWVRFEPEAVLGAAREPSRYVLNVVRWAGAGREEETLAEVDPHGRTMRWLG